MSWLFLDTHAPGQMRYGWLDQEGNGVQSVDERASSLLPRLSEQWDGEREGIEGVCVVAGPGSFSSVRVGVLDANLFARLLSVPLVSVTVDASSDLVGLARQLSDGSLPTVTYAVPIYDAEPNITLPKL